MPLIYFYSDETKIPPALNTSTTTVQPAKQPAKQPLQAPAQTAVEEESATEEDPNP
jgi:hypothetical protein